MMTTSTRARENNIGKGQSEGRIGSDRLWHGLKAVQLARRGGKGPREGSEVRAHVLARARPPPHYPHCTEDAGWDRDAGARAICLHLN